MRKLSKSSSASSSMVNSPILSRAESTTEVPLAIIPTHSTSSAAFQPRRLSQSRIPMPDPGPEYLKNVVLKFLDANQRSQRVQLVGVLGMLLKLNFNE